MTKKTESRKAGSRSGQKSGASRKSSRSGAKSKPGTAKKSKSSREDSKSAKEIKRKSTRKKSTRSTKAKKPVRKKPAAKRKSNNPESIPVYQRLRISAARRKRLQRQFQSAKRVLERHYDKLLDRQGVVGLGVGFRERQTSQSRQTRRTIVRSSASGEEQKQVRICDEVVIKVYVEKKLDPSRLFDYQRLPEKLGRGKSAFGIDVVEIGSSASSTATAHGGGRIRPAHQKPKTGTLGCGLSKDGEPALITNAHVAYGTRTEIPDVPDPIVIQANVGSRYKDFGSTPKNETGLGGKVDVAVLQLVRSDIDEVDNPPVMFEGTDEVTDDDLFRVVEKTGDKSGRTEGFISDPAFMANIDGTLLSNQILIDPLSGDPFQLEGDSGAVLIMDGKLVGLMHARINRCGVACKIQDVVAFFAELGIAIEFEQE